MGDFKIGNYVVRPELNLVVCLNPYLEIPVKAKAMDVLTCLAGKPGQVLSKDDIIGSVWNDRFVGDDVLTTAIFQLRQTFGDNPKSPNYIQTVRGRGYRLIPALESPGDVPVGYGSPAPERGGMEALSEWIKARPRPLLAIALALGIVLVWYLGVSQNPIHSVAVVPFRNATGDPEFDYLTYGIPEIIARALSPHLKVTSMSSTTRYRNGERGPATVGRELDVEALATGQLQLGEGGLVLVVELVDCRAEKLIWSNRYQGSEHDLPELSNDIVLQLANALGLSALSPERFPSIHSSNPVAQKLYLMGRQRWLQRTGENVLLAIRFFEKAAQIDPEYALAWSGLADAYWVLPESEGGSRELSGAKALSAAETGVSLNPSLAETLASLARATPDRDLKLEMYRRALQIDPHYSPALSLLGLSLLNSGLVEEAHEYVRRSQQVDPWSPMITFRAAVLDHAAGDYERAFSQYQHLAMTSPEFSPVETHSGLGFALWDLGRYLEAREVALKLARFRDGTRFIDFLSPDFIDRWLDQDWQAAEQLVVKALDEDPGYGRLWNYEEAATGYAALGLVDEPFALMEQHCELGGDAPLFLQISAVFDPLRASPDRWQSLLDCYQISDWRAALGGARQ